MSYNHYTELLAVGETADEIAALNFLAQNIDHQAIAQTLQIASTVAQQAAAAAYTAASIASTVAALAPDLISGAGAPPPGAWGQPLRRKPGLSSAAQAEGTAAGIASVRSRWQACEAKC